MQGEGDSRRMADVSTRTEMMRVLEDEEASDLLVLFLTKRYTEQSLLFYLAVRAWKNITEQKASHERAKVRLFHHHFYMYEHVYS